MARIITRVMPAGFIATAACIATLALSGCSAHSVVEGTGTTTWNDEGARELSKRVVYNNSTLAGDIQIVTLQSAVAGDLMRAQATLKSRAKEAMTLQYRFEWYDANGIEINSGSGSWKPLIVYVRETKTVQGVAPDPRAKEYKLKLREAEE